MGDPRQDPSRRKDGLEAEARQLLAAGVRGHVFPGASACIAWRDGDQTRYACAASGNLMPGGPEVRKETPYDLASLTKPFVATLALRLVAAERLELDARVDSVLSDVRGGPGGACTFEELFTHRSGLAPWGGLYLDVPHDPGTAAARRWILSESARRMENTKGQDVYSDLGYMIAGEGVARAAGTPLDKALKSWVTDPLGISGDVYYAGALPLDKKGELGKTAPPTERCEWRAMVIRGQVHDENCAALGGVAGHAGLFGTAKSVARLGAEMNDVLTGRSEFLPRPVLEAALAERDGGTHRFGWDSRGGQSQAAGRYMGPRTFGHLGFTGTSIWCDPDREVVVVLLSNRVHPSRANEKIKGFRPAFHDRVVAAFDASK